VILNYFRSTYVSKSFSVSYIDPDSSIRDFLIEFSDAPIIAIYTKVGLLRRTTKFVIVWLSRGNSRLNKEPFNSSKSCFGKTQSIIIINN